MKKWYSCTENPSITGRKVLCQKHGDFYVAMRLGKYYFPVPFVDHYFCHDLSLPDTWQEIDFPDGFTGDLRVVVDNDINNAITLSEVEVDYPEIYKNLFEMILGSIGTLKK